MSTSSAANLARGAVLENLQRVLGAQLCGLGWMLVSYPVFDAHSPGKSFASDLGVANAMSGTHSHTSAICAVFDILEPASDSIAERSRLEKIRRRQSVRDLVIINTSQWKVEHWFRSERSPWLFELLTGAKAAVHVRSLGIFVGLEMIYLHVGVARPRAND